MFGVYGCRNNLGGIVEQPLHAPRLAPGRTWTIVQWNVEPEDRFDAGDTLAILRASDGQEGEIRAAKSGRLTQMDYLGGASGIAGSATVGRFEIVSSGSRPRRRVGTVVLVVIILAAVAAFLISTDRIGDPRGGATTDGKSAANRPSVSDSRSSTGIPSTEPQSAEEFAMAQRLARCTRGSRMTYKRLNLSAEGIGKVFNANDYGVRVRARIAPRLEVVGCPVNAGGRPLARPFRRGDRVIVAWILSADRKRYRSRNGSLCLSTEVRGGHYYRSMLLARGIGRIASDGFGGYTDHFYRVTNEWPDDHWVGGRFEVKLSKSASNRPTVGVFAVRCSSSSSIFPGTYGPRLKAAS